MLYNWLQEVAAKVFREVAEVHALTMLRQEVIVSLLIYLVMIYLIVFDLLAIISKYLSKYA